MNRDQSSERLSIIEYYDASLHNQVCEFADSFGPEGSFIEDEHMETSVSRPPFKGEGEFGIIFIAGRPYGNDQRVFFSLHSSISNQAGSRRIATWPYRDHSHNTPIDPKTAFAEIIATYKMIIEGES